MSYKEIAKYSGVKFQTIASILRRWRKDKYRLISRVTYRRRRRLLSSQQEKLITNEKVLFQQAHLTLEQRIPILHRDHQVPLISKKTLIRIYHRHSVLYRRASYYYNKKFTMQRELSDRQQVRATEMARELFLGKKLIYVDETTFNLWTPSNYLWMSRSMNFPLQINRGKSVTVIGAIDEHEGLCHYYIFIGSNNTEKFLHFLEGLYVKQGITNGKLVMDNLSIHKSHRVTNFFSRHPTLEAYYIPPYSSAMNSIEKLWLILKGKWRRHLVQHAMEPFTPGRTVRDIENLLKEISQEKVKRLAKSNYKALAKSIRGNLV